MKIKTKRLVEPPAEVKPIVDAVVAAPLDQIADALQALFPWRFDKGDVHHWVPVLDRIDDYYAEYVEKRHDLKLDYSLESPEDDPPFPATTLTLLLTATTTILENCNNKHLYNSIDHIGLLLAAPDIKVVHAALQVLTLIARRTYPSSMSWTAPEEIAARILEMAKFINPGNTIPNLSSLSMPTEDQSLFDKDQMYMLHYEYYTDTTTDDASAAPTDSSASSHIVHVDDVRTQLPQHESLAIKQLIIDNKVPQKHRFALLNALRAHQCMSSVQGRQDLLRMRLLAFYVTFAAHPAPSAVSTVMATYPAFVQNLVNILRHEEQVPEDIMVIVLRVLGAQLMERQRSSTVVFHMQSGTTSPLTLLLHRAVASLTESQPVPVVHSVEFTEALLSFAGCMVVSREGLHALNEAGVLPAILPLVNHMNAKHVGVVSLTIRIIESFLDYSSTCHATFRELSGIKHLVDRMEVEVDAAIATSGTVPYARRLLLKSLLRTLSAASYSPGTPARPDETQSPRLYSCLVKIFGRAVDFGGGLFSLAASIMTELLHYDPLQYRNIEAAGVPAAFIRCINKGLIASPEAVSAVPSALIAMCLNSNGQKLVRKSKALECLIPVFTTKNYLRALQGEGASNLGTVLEELLRHAPALRAEGVGLALSVLHRLCLLGGDANPPIPLPPPEVAEQPAGSAGSTGEAEEPMETDNRSVEEMEIEAAPEAAPEAAEEPQQEEEEPEVEDIPPPELPELSPVQGDGATHLVECVTYTARMLDSLLRAAESAKMFVARGGADLLLTLYRLPALPPTFGSTNASHSLLSTFRTLTQPAAGIDIMRVFPPLCTALSSQLDIALAAAESIGDRCVPTLPVEERDAYVRAVSTSEGLAAMSAAVVRFSAACLKDVCGGEDCLILKIGALEKFVLRQAAVADIWKLQWVQEQEANKEKEAAAASSGTADSTAEATAADMSDNNNGAGTSNPPVAAANGNGNADPATAAEDKTKERKKKTQEELAHEILAHFLHTARSFYQAVAKAIHLPLRRREEVAPPTLAMQTAALNLAVVITRNLLPSSTMSPEEEWAAPAELAQGLTTPASIQCRYLHRALDATFNTLFDTRRRSSHVLVYAYFVACGGLRAFMQQFHHLTGLLEKIVDLPRAAGEDVNLVESDPNSFALSSARDPARAYKAGFMAVTNSFLVLMTNLSYPSMVVSASNVVVMVTGAIPGTEDLPNGPIKPATNVEAFVKRVWSMVLGAVLPLWRQPRVVAMHPRIVQAALSVIRNCTEQPGAFNIAPTRSGRTTAADIARIQQLRDMGFSRAAAEEALRRVGNNTALAMEWLVTHPDELMALEEGGYREAPAAAPAAANTNAAAAGGASAENSAAAATATLAASIISRPQRKIPPEDVELIKSAKYCVQLPGSDQTLLDLGKLDDIPTDGLPTAAALTEGAINILAMSPISAFHLADMLKVQCGLGVEQREAIANCLMSKLKELLAAGVATAKAPESTSSDETMTALHACCHLLLVLTMEANRMKEVLASKDVVDTALKLVESWVDAHCIKTSSAGKTSSSEQQAIEPVPKWVDALLLTLDTLCAAHSKKDRGITGSGITGRVHTTISAHPASLTRAESQEAESSAPPSEEELAKRSLEKAITSILTSVGNTWQVGGLLSEEEQMRVAHIGLRLLPHLSAWASNWMPPPKPDTVDAGDASSPQPNELLSPDPRSTLVTVLQLLARFSIKRQVAEAALTSKAHVTLLNLPPVLFVPEIEAHAATLFRHMMEDPATLQAAMEASMRNVLLEKANRPRYTSISTVQPPNSMSFRSFLQYCAPLAVRDITLFVETLRSLCDIRDPGLYSPPGSLGGRSSSRATISLKPVVKPGSAAAEASKEADAKKAAAAAATTPGSGGQKKEPEQGVSTRSASKKTPVAGTSQQAETTTPAAALAAPGATATTPVAKQTAPKTGKKVPGTFTEVIDCLLDVLLKWNGPAGDLNAPVAEETAGTAEPVAMDTDIVAEAQPAADAANTTKKAKPQVLTPGQRDVALQSFVLRLLADFTLRYQNCVAVLLKRDSDLATYDPTSGSKTGTGKSSTAAQKRASISPSSGVLKHLMHCQLALAPAYVPPGSSQSMANAASYVLLCICIRSVEGRRRIAAELAKTLNGLDAGSASHHSKKHQQQQQVQNLKGLATENSPFIAVKGGAPPYKVLAFVGLASSLLSASAASRPGASGTAPSSGLSIEVTRAMKDAGMASALTNIINRLDVDHPLAVNTAQGLLRGLEVLTRPLPRRSSDVAQPAGGKPGQADASGSGGASGQAVAETPAAQDTEAGPAALAAAQNAMEALDGGRGRRAQEAMNDVMEEMIERAYEEELLAAEEDSSPNASDDEMSHSSGDGPESSSGMSDSDDSMDDDDGSESDDDSEPIVVEIVSDEEDDSDSDIDDMSGEDDDDNDDDDDELGPDAVDDGQGNFVIPPEFREAVEQVIADMEEGFVGEEGEGGEFGIGNAEEDSQHDEDVDEDEEEDDEIDEEEAEAYALEDDMQDMYIDDDAVAYDEEDEDLLIDYPGGGDEDIDEEEADALREPADFNGSRQRLRSRRFDAMMQEFGMEGAWALPLARRTGRPISTQELLDSSRRNGTNAAQAGPTRHPLLVRPSSTSTAATAGAPPVPPGIGGATDGLNMIIPGLPSAAQQDFLNAFQAFRADGNNQLVSGLRLPPWMSGPGSLPAFRSVGDMGLGGGALFPGSLWANEAPDSNTVGQIATDLEQELVGLLGQAPEPTAAAAPSPAGMHPSTLRAMNDLIRRREMAGIDEEDSDEDHDDSDDDEPAEREPERVEEQQQVQQPAVVEEAVGAPVPAAPVAPAAASNRAAPSHHREQPALSPGQARPRQRQRTESSAPAPTGGITADIFAQALSNAMQAAQQQDAPAPVAADTGDVEMVEAAEQPEEAAPPAAAQSMDSGLIEAAARAGIDAAFLQALPDELRSEVLRSAGVEYTAVDQQAPADAQQQQQQAPAAVAATTQDQPATEEQPAAAVAAVEAEQQPAPGPSNPAAAQPEADEIDPEFLAALPPELQAEVLEQHRRERRLRESAARRERQRAEPAVPSDMDFASLVASFPADVREEVLLTVEEEMLSTLPSALLAEARALREARGYRPDQTTAPAPWIDPGRVVDDEEEEDMVMHDHRILNRFYRDMMEGPLAHQLRGARMSAGAGWARGGGRLGAVGRPAGGAGTSNAARRSALTALLESKAASVYRKRNYLSPTEPAAEIDEAGLVVLLRLFKLGPQLSRGSMTRLFFNLCSNTQSRESVLRMLMSVLTSPLTADEVDATKQSHLKQPANVILGLAKSHEAGLQDCVPDKVVAKALDILIHLVKHHPKVHEMLLSLKAPTLDTVAARLAAKTDVKGKGKAVDLSKGMFDPTPIDGSSTKNMSTAFEALLAMPLRQYFMTADAAMSLAIESIKECVREYEYANYTRIAKMHAAQIEENAKKKKAEEEAKKDAAAPEGGAEPSTSVAAAEQQPATIHPTTEKKKMEEAEKADDGTKEYDRERGAKVDSFVSALEGAPIKNTLKALTRLMINPELTDRNANTLRSNLCSIINISPSLSTDVVDEIVVVMRDDLGSKAVEALETLASHVGMSGDANNTIVLTSGTAQTGRMMARCVNICWELVHALEWTPAVAWGPGVKEEQFQRLAVSLDQLQKDLTPVWKQFSTAAGHVEHVLRAAQTTPQGTVAETSRVLPASVAQLQPLTECYFMLADALRAAHNPPDEEYITNTKPNERIPWLESSQGQLHNAPLGGPFDSGTLSFGGSGEIQAQASLTSPQPSQTFETAPSSPTKRAMSDKHSMQFLKFAERHRRLVNALVAHSPALLKGALSLLLRAPRLLDFDNKRAYFRAKMKERDARVAYGNLRLNVRRKHVFEDSFYQLRVRTPDELRSKLNVQFTGEEGVDAGGLTREWYQVISREMFNPQFSLFQAVPEAAVTFQPNPNSVVQSDPARGTDHLDFFKFVGRVVGKALHDSQHIDAHFTRSFYKHMLGAPLTYEDIEAVDPDFYKNLKWMLENDITDVLDLTFAEETDYFGKKDMVELKPGGLHVKVTNANKREYVDLVARHRMTNAIRPQIDAFLRGFWEIVPREFVSLFNDHELELLISGLPEIDVDDMRANTIYQGFSASSTVVTWFWEVVKEMDAQDLALLVQFATGTSKVPLEGFKALQGVNGAQKFQIHKAYGPTDRLPSAHTCFNQLDLYEYESKEQLRDRLMTAIHEGSEGFAFA